MSSDRPRSRKDISSEITRRERDQQKRLRDAQKVVKDKKTEQDTARSLKLGGTSEGMRAVKKSVEAAARETEREHKKQEAALNREVFQPARRTEQELKGRSDASKGDSQEARKAGSRMDTKAARTQMAAAEHAAQEDRAHLDREKKHQETDRKKGEAEIKKQRMTIQGTKISFRS